MPNLPLYTAKGVSMRLYFKPGACSMSPNIVSRELGIPLDLVKVDLKAKTYLAPGRQAVELPESMELKLLTARSEASSDKVGRIRFFADGGSTGGRVTLISGAGGREWKVNVSWLTGEIELDDGRKERRT